MFDETHLETKLSKIFCFELFINTRPELLGQSGSVLVFKSGFFQNSRISVRNWNVLDLLEKKLQGAIHLGCSQKTHPLISLMLVAHIVAPSSPSTRVEPEIFLSQFHYNVIFY